VHEDSGFERHQQKGIMMNRPINKPGGKELNQKQKNTNKHKASKRVMVEHSVEHLKILGY
jgi:hypothetical protein